MKLHGPGVVAFASLLLFPACAKKIETEVQDAVRKLDDAHLKREDIEVLNVRQTGSSAVAEVKIRTAVQLQKEEGKWEVEEIRIGDRRWEQADRLVEALQAERARSTRAVLDRLAEAIEDYRQVNGSIPRVDSFEALIDELVTRHFNEPVRLDAWSRSFEYRVRTENSYELRSAGPDGVLDTEDDLTKGNQN